MIGADAEHDPQNPSVIGADAEHDPQNPSVIGADAEHDPQNPSATGVSLSYVLFKEAYESGLFCKYGC